MERTAAIRATASLGVALIGCLLAVSIGASSAAAMLALLAGAAAFAVAPRPARQPATSPPSPPAGRSADALPSLSELLDAIEDPMLVIRERRVIAANAAARTILGDHIQGADVRLAIRHPAAAEQLSGPAAGEAGVTRTELVGLGDPDRQWRMAVWSLPDGGRLVRLSDQSHLRAADQMRVDFVANASHELRTPLATLLGFLETLTEDDGIDPDSRRRFLGIMFNEATRMRSLVDDLTSLSRIEAERFTLPTQSVPLLPLIDETGSALAQLIGQRSSEIMVDNRAGSATVSGDRPQLGQLFNNLIVNAIKYGRAGTPVRILLEDAGDFLKIAVADEGEGIAAEHIPRLTERFYRVDAGRSRSIGGTGLGLAIAKHIVLRHRGRLEISSILGRGTTVQVLLPKPERDVG